MARGGMYAPPRIRFLNQKQMNRQANRQVRSSIQAAQAPIVTAQTAADARAAAAQKAIQGFGLAAAGMLQSSAGQAGQAYKDAASAESALAGGYSSQAADAVRGQVAHSQGLIDQLAPGGQLAAGSTDPSGMSDAMYAQGGYIPGAANEQLAASAITHASELPGIQALQTGQDIQAAQAQQEQNDQTYTQQMLDIAAKEPDLRNQIMQQLQANELAKRNAWVQQQAQDMVQQRFGVTARQSQQRINIEQHRMQVAEAQGNARIALEAGNLRLSQARDRQAVRQALVNGQRIDSSASHAAGYLIDHNGNPILNKRGKRIPVHSSSGTGAGGTGPGSTEYKQAYRYASSNYIAPKIAGVADPTFSRPPFAQMQAHLARAYGINRRQARRILVGLGIKPDGKRR